MKEYLVGIVGERSYQPQIRRCREGARALLMPEPDNPHDPRAIRVVSAGGTIGYIARDSWMQRAIHDESKSYTATIHQIAKKGKFSGVVLAVIAGQPAAEPQGFLGLLRRLFSG